MDSGTEHTTFRRVSKPVDYTGELDVVEILAKVKREMELRNYRKRSIEAYVNCIGRFLKYAGRYETIKSEPEMLVREFLETLMDKDFASKTINLYLQAVKFVYRRIFKIDIRIDITISKAPRKLPVVLSKEEIERILAYTANKKHKLIIALAYGAGLRVSEVVSLKVENLYLDEDMIMIRNGKGGKDRVTLIPDRILPDLKKICSVRDPDCFVFESERGGRLHERTAQKIFSNSLKRAGIRKPASFHSLRHSFATHLLEEGIDIYHIKELMGHKDIRTTQIYAKVTRKGLARIKSPLSF